MSPVDLERHKQNCRDWDKKHPERRKAIGRNQRLKRKFGITLEDYTEMLNKQGGTCGLCGGVSAGRDLGVDHDHETGAIRMLLCISCNSALGLFKDDPSLMRKAAEYVERFRSAANDS